MAIGKRQVTYIHLMFEDHQILFAAGIPSESFYPGPAALHMLSGGSRESLFAVFPKLDAVQGQADVLANYGPTARTFLENKKAVRVWQRRGRELSEQKIRDWDLDLAREYRENEELPTSRVLQNGRFRMA
jgi:hypothetical protein